MKTTLFVLITLFSTSIFAQDFSLIIKKPFQSALFDITQSYDGNLFAVGFSQSFQTNSSQESKSYTDAFEYLQSLSDAHGTQMHLLKVDAAQEILLDKALKLSQMNQAKAVIKLPDGGFVVGGERLDGAILIVKISAQGELYFSQTYDTPANEKMNDMQMLGDDGLLIIGSATTTRGAYDGLFESGLGKSDIYLLRLSKSGEKLWSNRYGGSEDDLGVSISTADDGSHVIAAKSFRDGKNQLMLLRTNESGAKLWQKMIETPYDAEPTKIIRLRNGTFLVVLKEHNKQKKEHIRLMQINLHGETLANKEIFTNYPSALLDIAEFANGTLMGVGYVRDESNTDALAMQLSKNLTLLNQEHYGSKSYDLFSSLAILNNSQVAAAGVHTEINSQESNMWIVKLNANATLAQSASKQHTLNQNDLYKQLRKLFADEISKKELSIKSDLTVEFLDPRLYFKTGVYRLTSYQEHFLDRFAKKLVPFLHKHQNKIAQLEINGHTSSEWANADFTSNYIQNAELSMQRSFGVMHFIFKKQNRENQLFLSKILKESGLSYSKKATQNGKELKEQSRRVNFRVVLK